MNNDVKMILGGLINRLLYGIDNLHKRREAQRIHIGVKPIELELVGELLKKGIYTKKHFFPSKDGKNLYRAMVNATRLPMS